MMKRIFESILTGLATGVAIVAAQEIIWRRFPREITDAEVRARKHLRWVEESVRQSQTQTQIMREIVDAILFAAEKKEEEDPYEKVR